MQQGNEDSTRMMPLARSIDLNRDRAEIILTAYEDYAAVFMVLSWEYLTEEWRNASPII